MRQLVKNQAAINSLCVAALSLSLTMVSGTNETRADSFYNWTFNAGSVTAGGTFQVNSSNIIVAITNGTVTGFPGSSSTITALLPPGSFLGNDNVFNSTSPFLTFNGVSFFTNKSLNLYKNSSGLLYYLSDDPDSFGNAALGAFALSQ